MASRRLTRPFWVFVAALFLLEAWLWDLVSPWVHRVVALLPWEQAKAAVARSIVSLPPTVVLCIFIVPHVIAVPVELIGIWFAARGHFVTGVVLYGVSKGISVIFTLLLFEVCKPKLMELTWFREIYSRLVEIRAWAHRQIDPIRERIGETMRALRQRVFGETRGFTRMMRRVRARIRRP